MPGISDTMNQQKKAQLSALIDNEESGVFALQISKRLSSETELRQTLTRYQLISDGLRGEDINIRSLDIVQAVSKRLESEPTVLAPSNHSKQWHKWMQPAAGAALAASVAALGIMLGPQLINPQPGAAPVGAGVQVVAQPPADVQMLPAAAEDGNKGHWKTLADEEQTSRRLRSYLEQHSQFAAPGGVQGVMPYTSYVSYDGAAGK